MVNIFSMLPPTLNNAIQGGGNMHKASGGDHAEKKLLCCLAAVIADGGISGSG
jgi:hypothetical protein